MLQRFHTVQDSRQYKYLEKKRKTILLRICQKDLRLSRIEHPSITYTKLWSLNSLKYQQLAVISCFFKEYAISTLL